MNQSVSVLEGPHRELPTRYTVRSKQVCMIVISISIYGNICQNCDPSGNVTHIHNVQWIICPSGLNHIHIRKPSRV
jgi:hypothetical protein